MRYISTAFFLLLFCTPDHLVERSKADYLPLQIDNSWTYVSGVDSLFISVIGDSTIDSRDCLIIVFGDRYRYWHHDEEGVREYYEFSVGPSGIEYNLESRYYPIFPFPLIDGYSFGDSFSHTEIIEGDTVYFFHRVTGQINIKEKDRYKVAIEESLDIHSAGLDSTDSYSYFYTLAPNIGIEIYQDRNGRIWDLQSYSVK